MRPISISQLDTPSVNGVGCIQGCDIFAHKERIPTALKLHSPDPAMWTIPLLVMLSVALHQRWRVRRYGQSVWKGGGFGMFADIEGSAILTYIEIMDRDQKPIILGTPPGLAGDLERCPTEKNIFAYARSIAERPWIQAGAIAVPRETLAPLPPLSPTAVIVTHFRLSFDARTGQYRSHPSKRSPYRLKVIKK
jgi:hypothetical protein